MNAAAGHALEQALAYYRAPAMLSVARDRRLPDDVLDVLRIAAGDESLAAQGAGSSGEPQATVVDAAVFFVQQVLFAPGADSYRVLGVNADAPDARIKEHYRWLVRWLHPDRNLDDWDSVYAERVNRAWQDLRLPERRAAYDVQRAAGELAPPASVAPSSRALGRLHAAVEPTESMMSARTAQRLPMFVLGGLGLAAVSMLALMWYATVGQGPARPAPPQASETLDPDALHAAAQAPAPAIAIAAEPEVPAPAPVETPSVAPEPAALAVADVAPEAAPVPSRDPGGSQVPGAASMVEPAPAVVSTPITRPPAPVAPAPVARAPVAQAPRPASTPAPRPVAPPAAARAAPPADSLAAVVAAPPRAPEPQVPVVPRVDRQQAYGVLEQFSTAYAAGDINGLMRLFTQDARNNRGGRDAIVFDYQSLFSGTLERELRFLPTGWMQGEPDKATLLASYQAQVTVAGKRQPDASRGQIRFDLRREDGVLRISQIRIENAD